jgi:hypothetical protein
VDRQPIRVTLKCLIPIEANGVRTKRLFGGI